MSIYSGFPTRRDETKYNDLLSRLILMLQHHLLEAIGDTELSHKKIVNYTKVISKMKEYEQHKYLPPKFSQLLEPLCKAIGFINTNATVQQVVIDEEQGRVGLQKLRSMKLPADKQRIKTKMEEEPVQYMRMKTSSLRQQFQRPASRPKKKMFEYKELKQKKIPQNICDFTGKDQIKVKPQTPLHQVDYEQGTGRHQHSRISASHPLISSVKHSKNNFRYRSSNAPAQAQENVQKRVVPLREQMRKRLKSTGNGE